VDAVSGFLWFLFGVDTYNRLVEELDICFEAAFPPTASWKRTELVNDDNDELGVKLADLRS
jgi:hypothetical protein